ncbi:unnamed protein product [Cylindrotheca closterium]|uniref:MULE transposase domain-containing protein n=1 Tax=Cylindrotheca closterium TaxID=2856 RepID=A0AAD2FM58_9STRA|nr:unnamed protein product [Cylindrotheca closterium]
MPIKKNKDEYDAQGVRFGLCHKSHHHDRKRNRVNGQTKPRATRTAKDTTGNCLCNCPLSLKFSRNKEFIYLACKGEKIHKYHPKAPGPLPLKANNLTDEQKQQLLAQQRAAVANPQSRKILLELKQGYISKSAYRTVMITAPDYIAAKAVAGANSSAAEFIGWLRAQAANPETNLSYMVLSYALTSKNCCVVRRYIQNPKGWRSNSNPPSNPETVMNNLTYRDELLLPIEIQEPLASSRKSTPTPPIGKGGLVAKNNLCQAAIDRVALPMWQDYCASVGVEDHLQNTKAIREKKEAIFCRAANEVDNQTIRNSLAYTSGDGKESCDEDTACSHMDCNAAQGKVGIADKLCAKPAPIVPKGLYSIANVSIANQTNDNFAQSVEVESTLKGVAPMVELVEQAETHLLASSDTIMSPTKVMLGGAWMTEAEKRHFFRFPEVLFIDATHKSNNKGRPLLLVCGRDSGGKAFAILQMFMPNETKAFYWWVFLEVLPAMLGVAHLKRVNLILTDGDANEYNALDQGIFHYFKNAIRGRCGHHLIEKTIKSHGPSDGELENQCNGRAIILEVKQWVRSWVDGSSCGTKEQFEFSKQLLLSWRRSCTKIGSNKFPDCITQKTTAR